MTATQYISRLTSPAPALAGAGIPQDSRADVIDGLCAVIADKDAVIADKDAVIADKDAVISARDMQIEKQRQRILWLERKVFGRSSERFRPEDPNQLTLDFGEEKVVPLGDSELEEASARVEAVRAGVHEAAVKRRADKPGRGSRKGLQYRVSDSVPRRDPVRHYPEGYTPETMVVIGWNRHEHLEIEGPKAFVRVDLDAICKPGDSRPADAHTAIVEAHGAQNCLPGCIAGNTTMASLVTDKFCHHIPEYRQARRLGSVGLRLSTSSINRWMHDLAGRLDTLYEMQMEKVLSSEYQHIDESAMPVNDRRGKTRKGYIWASVDGMGAYGLVFFYEKGSRGGKVLGPKLLHRRAAIQSDGYSVYENIERSKLDGITTLYCMAHARRKFEQIKDTSPEARKILEYIATLYELEANLKYEKAGDAEKRRQRQEKAVPILGLIKLMLVKYKAADTPQGLLAQACGYALERWDGLCRYCEEGYYEIDNNAVERSIRPLTLGRKNWLFVDSDDSAHDTAIYMTLTGSCNLLGIDPYKYFCTILPKLHDNMTDGEWEGLLPYKVAETMKNK